MIASRPFIIIGLSLFHLLYGGYYVLQDIIILLNFSATQSVLTTQLGLVLLVTLVLYIICMIAGVGVLIGAQWGWVLSLFFFQYRFVEHAWGLYKVLTMENTAFQFQPTGDLRTFFGMRVAIYMCVLIFVLINNTIHDYFAFKQSKTRIFFLSLILVLLLFFALEVGMRGFSAQLNG